MSDWSASCQLKFVIREFITVKDGFAKCLNLIENDRCIYLSIQNAFDCLLHKRKVLDIHCDDVRLSYENLSIRMLGCQLSTAKIKKKNDDERF